MASFSRLFDLASRAVDKAASARSSRSSAGGHDWRDLARQAMDAVTGDDRTARSTSPAAPAPTGRASSASSSGRNPAAHPRAAAGRGPLTAADRDAIARYDYLLRTASPEQVEQLHREAFARLTPAQRSHVRARMDADLATHERPHSDSPDDLARAAGRAEAHRPGRMRSLLARAGGAGAITAGAGGAAALIAVVAEGAAMSAVAVPFLEHAAAAGVDFAGIAEGVDLDALASGLDLESLATGVPLESLGDLGGGAGEAISGVGEQISGVGDRLGDLRFPGLGDFLGR